MPQNFLNLNQDHQESLSDRLLKASANATSVLLTISSLDVAVNTALKIIGEALDTDRVTVIENFNQPDQPILCWRMLYEWDSPNTVSQIAHPEVSQGTIEGVESWIEKLSQGERLSYCLDEMPEPFRSGQEKLGVKVLHIVPIFVEGKHWGEFGFDDCREFRERGQAELATLQIIANSIGGAIQRERTQMALLQSEQARITELTKVNAELLQRDRLQETTTVVANTLLTISPFEIALKTALQIIGEALDADRVNVVENFNHPLDSSSLYWRALEYEWCSPNTVSQFLDPDSTQGSYADIPSLIEIFTQGKSISYVIEDMPEPFRSKQIAIGVKSTHIVPIFIEGKWWGVLGLDDCREVKHRSPVELSLLNIAANCIGSAILRDRTQKALLCSEQERAAELESANKALRNAIAGMARLDNLEHFLAEMLKASIEISGAHSGAVALIEGGFIRHAVLFDQDGWIDPQIQMSRGLTISPFTPELKDLADQLLKSHFDWVVPPDDPRIMPEFREFHREHNNKAIRLVPMQISDRLIGWLGLGFAEENPPIGKSFGLLKVLAEQMTMAVEMLRLSNEAQQTAIAREREQSLLIHEKQRTAELKKANAALSRSLSWLAKEENLNNFLEQILLEISITVQADIAHLFILHQPERMLEIVARVMDGQLIQSPTPSEPAIFSTPFPADITPIFAMMEEQDLFLTLDMLNIQPELRDLTWPDNFEWHINAGRKALGALVLKAGDRSVGFLGLGFHENQELVEEKRQLVIALANQAALAILLMQLAEQSKQAAIAREREQAARERATELESINTELQQALSCLRTTEERFRTLFESSSEGFYFVEVDPPVATNLSIDEQCTQLYQNVRVILANSAFASMYGFANPDACIGIKNADVHVSCSEKNAAFIRGLVENGYNFCDLETEEIDTHQQLRYFLNSGRLTIKDGYIVGGWGSQVDITQLRQTQQALLINEKQRTAKLEKANETLSRSLSWLAREEDLNKFLEQILLEISETLQAARGHLFVLHQPNRILEIVARVKDGQIIQDLDPSEPTIFAAPFSADITPLFSIMEKQNLFMIVDMTQLPDELSDIAWPDSLEWHRQEGYKACAALVLKTGDRSVGFLGLTFEENQEIVEEKRQLVIALANQASLAILLMQLAEQSKQAAIAQEQERAAAARVMQLVKANAVLKQTLDVLATEPEIESSLGHVLKVSSEQLDSPSSALWLYNSSTEKFYLHLVYMDNQIIPVTAQNIDLLTGKWLRGRKLASDLFLKKHIHERSPAIYQVDDTSVVPPPLRKSLENMGVKTLLGIPLLLGSEIIGSFTLRFTEKRQFQAEELELTQALANQATLAIQLLRMAEEAKQAAIYEERNRLAGEIHDTLAQAFTGISLQLGVVKWLLQEGSLALEPILDRINDIAQTGLAEARRSVWEIYPTAQEYSNLADKLSQAVEKLTRDCPIQVDLQILGSEYQVSAMIGYNLLKLAQEAITNALKHAKATKLAIILNYRDALVSLRITDNGCGFQPNLDNGGFGLLSISERSDRIGGQLLINSILGKGTEILVEIPLEEQKS